LNANDLSPPAATSAKPPWVCELPMLGVTLTTTPRTVFVADTCQTMYNASVVT
jgi:hypothetical protein